MTPDQMEARARKLTRAQRDARGWRKGRTVDDKPCLIIEHCKSTPEMQERAAEILWLRRAAAKARYAR